MIIAKNKIRVGFAVACTCLSSLSLHLPAARALDVTVSPGGNLQAALDQVGTAGGGTVHVNSGNYAVTATVKIPNNTTLKGVTTRPVITQTVRLNNDVIANKSIPCSNVKADFLSVNGGLSNAQMDAGTYNETFGIDLSDQHQTTSFGSNATIINCNCTNASQGYVIGTINNARLDSCNVTNCGGAPKGTTPGLHNIYIATCNPFVGQYVNASNCRTGMGFKVTDFNGQHTESSILIQNNTCNNNFDRGMAIYDENPVTVQNNTCNNNLKSGINIFRSTSGGKLLNNHATGNGNTPNVAYDIWLNGCTGMTITGNTYGTKSGF